MTTPKHDGTVGGGTGPPPVVRSIGERAPRLPDTTASAPRGGALQFQTTIVIDGVLLVTLAGDIDVSNSDWLSGRMTTAITDSVGTTGVVVDLTRVGFCDASGITVLVTALKLCRTRDGALELAGAHGKVARVLQITGVDRVLPLHTGLDGALRALARR